MSVVIETTIGDITVDLFLKERPQAALNFLKLCKLKYYNYNLFHTIQSEFIAQTGDPSGVGDGGMSIWGILEGEHKRYFEGASVPKIKHSEPGLLSMVNAGEHLIGSQFFFTLGADLTSLDGRHTVIGEVTEGHEVLRKLNEVICDERHRPYKDVRITHTVVLDDPFDDPRGFREPSRSPSPSAERLQGGRIAADEEIDDLGGKTEQEIAEMIAEREAKARATILEIVGDIPDADIAPPENVLFVCKLNPVTTDDDLQIIFSRFGMIKGCEVIRDKLTGDSLQYAFIEFENQKSCEDAYFKMDNVLIDDRRIHVDFSQSVSKVKWRGKGRGIEFKDGADKRSFKDFDGKKQQSNRNGGGSRMEHQNVSPQRRAREQEKPRNRSESRSRSRSASRSRPIKADRGRQRSRSRDRMQNRDRDRNRPQGRNVQEGGVRGRKPKLTERNSAYLEQRNGRDIRINQGKVDYKNRPYPNSFVQRKGPRDKNAKRGGNLGPRASSGKRHEPPPRRRSRSRSRDRRMRRSRSGSRSRDRRHSSDRYRSHRSYSREAKGRRPNDAADRVVNRQSPSQQRSNPDFRRVGTTKSIPVSSDRDQQRESKPTKRRSASSGSTSPPPKGKRKRSSSRSSKSASSSSSGSHSESDERSKKRKKKSAKKKSKRSSSKSDRKRKDSISSNEEKHRKKSKGKKKKRKH
ncbi:peptidyl-prolyl cis-trans isomerase sig-7 [Anopheles funestus]|uniref:peptidyl-prolyl cis-trans isomerase sig-7 n=1 Tax=Anopheles funestus TaxID=62324 RepID=UPI0020C70F64|nr:peptidyl-prolyl cis-trans isomerase sig-7 [Anopheles funestus]